MTEAEARAACSRPQMGALLPRYEFGALTNSERSAFERHVLECEACFEELERGFAAAGTLRDHSGEFLRVLDEARRETAGSAVPAARRGSWLDRVFRAPVAVPALVVLVATLVITTWLARRPGEARFATFPREAMPSETVRAPGTDDAARELMASGAAYCNLGRYDMAARRFRAARERDPSSAEAAYALGLSMALAGDARGAIPHLEAASRLASGDLRDKAGWVLANAYLRAGDGAAARRELSVLATGSGEFAARARELAARLAH
jgi:tetratricopeptide (TPR) repeat protein